MVIRNVKIKNFRCYYGTSELSFNADGKITLIYGDSGYGKSSFLQFFRWMFYNECDFGKSDDKPLFNITAYNESKIGDTVEVSGQIDFDHLGVSYRLNKTQLWSVSFKTSNSSLQQSYWKLQVKGDDDSYHPFTGDVPNKINTILPKELSKYFLLDGERSRDIVLDSRELKKAIYALFGLDVYNDAISHVGTRNSKCSVLGHYANLLAANASKTEGEMSAADLQETAQELYDEIEKLNDKRKEIISFISIKNARLGEIYRILGVATTKGNLESLIKANRRAINDNEEKIIDLQHKIGNLFYQSYPYLFLAKLASKSSNVLRKKNLEYSSNYRNVFENLKKDLLIEVIHKNMCVCGRELDETSRKKIKEIINIMPPNSYIYEFGQFVSKAKKRIKMAQNNTFDYEEIISRIAQLENDNLQLEDQVQEKLEEIRRLNVEKDLIDELEQIKLDIDKLNQDKSNCDSLIAQKKLIYDASNRKLNKQLKNCKISVQYQDCINFFEKVVELLRTERDLREKQVKEAINNCVREIFKQLTTQTELNADKIQFVNDDFSLRTTYLTGGQLAVDVYSYVIGIIKALQECNIDNNENPIIVDAPFAFTGNRQSEHIFETFPKVSKQTILLTLDLNKIKKLLSETQLYDFYIIKNESQERATIVRGDINAIKF